MNGRLIKVENLSFSYSDGVPVLKNINIELAPGERVGLVGHVGCGKTTLLHLIVGLLKPTEGTITAFGRVRRDESDFHEVRRRAGLVFQDADDQLFCPTVAEDVAFGPLNLGKSPEEAIEIADRTLRLLGIDGFQERITYDLSGGEKRLVSIATVLAMEPDALLLDEPTNGLDEDARARITAVLDSLPQAMIIVSHDREFIDALATRVLEMTKGAIVSRE